MPRRTVADPVARQFGAAVREARRQRGETLEQVSHRIARMDAKESLLINCRHYGVVPLWVELVSLDLHGGELLVGDFDLGGVGVLVKAGVDL